MDLCHIDNNSHCHDDQMIRFTFTQTRFILDHPGPGPRFRTTRPKRNDPN